MAGGAVRLDNTGKVVFESSTFDSNYVVINGECCNNYGGAISARNTYDTLIVRNSKFKYNKVYAPSGNNGGQAKGGAIYANDLSADLLIENSLFEGNSAEASKHTWSNGSSDNGANGGALWLNLRHFQSGQTIVYPYKSILVNNTFVNNKALGSGNNNGRGGALYYEWANSTTIFNNVFFGNRGNNNSDSTYHEVDIFNQSSMEIYAGYNNFQHVTPDAANSYGTNNISRDPQFVLDGSGDQYALSDASFLIGAGIKTFEGKTAPTKDILGNTRPSGSSTDNPDIGAYEDGNTDWTAGHGWNVSTTFGSSWMPIHGATISGNSGFRMMSSPVSGTIMNDLLDELWIQGMTGGDVTDGTANVWLLDLAGQSWSAVSNISSQSLTAGQGFLVYVFDDIDFDNDSDLPVDLYVSGSHNSGNVSITGIPQNSFYLAGNPYTKTIDWDDISKTNLSTTISVMYYSDNPS